jgi:hypothetical protein
MFKNRSISFAYNRLEAGWVFQLFSTTNFKSIFSPTAALFTFIDRAFIVVLMMNF